MAEVTGTNVALYAPVNASVEGKEAFNTTSSSITNGGNAATSSTTLQTSTSTLVLPSDTSKPHEFPTGLQTGIGVGAAVGALFLLAFIIALLKGRLRVSWVSSSHSELGKIMRTERMMYGGKAELTEGYKKATKMKELPTDANRHEAWSCEIPKTYIASDSRVVHEMPANGHENEDSIERIDPSPQMSNI